MPDRDDDRRTDGDQPPAPALRGWIMTTAMAVCCAVIGFLLVAQVRGTEDVTERLAAEREEDLAVILGDLTTQSERLQGEIADLRLLLFEFESTAEAEELALRSLQKRLDDLRILTGVVPAESQGVVLTIEDPDRQLQHQHLVDVVHEMRNAGAEAIAVNNIRLVASSSFSTRNGRLLVDGQPVDSPYRIAAVGPSEQLISAGLAIHGGALYTLEDAGVQASIEELEQLTIPARAAPVPFVYGVPVPTEADSG